MKLERLKSKTLNWLRLVKKGASMEAVTSSLFSWQTAMSVVLPY